MADAFASHSAGLDSPAAFAAEVTPSDSVDLVTHARCLFVGAEGNVKVTTSGGSTVTFNYVLPGQVLPVRVARVWATGTTAGSIVALW